MANHASLPIAPAALRSSEAPRYPFAALPRGWFVVAFSDDLVPGAPPIVLRYFARDLVAYRGASGRAFVTSAYCPHLGAHLGHGGSVEGDALRCPFHGWRFGGDGRCAGIPYGDHVPPRAHLETFPVVEQNGVVHVFFDPQGGEPWELPTLDEAGWTKGRTVHWKGLRTHPQEVFENTVDTAHIGPVHDGREARLLGPPRRNRERMVVELEFQAPGDVVGMPGTLNDVHLLVTLHGLGVVIVQTHVRNAGVRARQRIYATPVDESSIDIRGIVHVEESDDAALTEEIAQIFHRAYVEDFARDFPIWENKRYLSRPAICKGDGPIGVYRHWCEQFYEASPTVAAPAPGPRASLAERASGFLVDLRGRAARLRARVVAREQAPRPTPAARGRDEPPALAGPQTPAPLGRPAPPRVQSASEYVATLAARFVPAAAGDLDAVFQWDLGGPAGALFHARVAGGRIEVLPGRHERPTVTLSMDADDYVRVVNGDADGTRLFASGRGRVRGDLGLAMRMRAIFPAR